jgi:tellurite resistance protein
MELTKDQRRAILAMCCIVARSDGTVSSSEYEQLLDLLARLAQGAVGFSELEQWLNDGPPAIEVRLPETAIRMFLREALTLAKADGKLEDVELATIKELVSRYFEAPKNS